MEQSEIQFTSKDIQNIYDWLKNQALCSEHTIAYEATMNFLRENYSFYMDGIIQ